MKVYHLVIGMILFVLVLVFAEAIARLAIGLLIIICFMVMVTIFGAFVWLCETLYRLWKGHK